MSTSRRRGDSRADPRVLYQRGLEQSHRGELVALQTLASALEAFRRSSDAHGAALAAAALLITCHSMNTYRRFGEYADAVRGVHDRTLVFDDPEDELIVRSGALCAALMLDPSSPNLDANVARILDLLALDLDVNARFAAGRLVIYYTEPRELREVGQRVFSLLQPSERDAGLTAHRLGRWLIIWIRVTANAKDPTQHRRARERAQELVDREGEPEVSAWVAGAEIEQGLRARDFARIERALARIENISDPANLWDMTRLAWLRGRIALAKGEGEAALFNARRARKYSEELELPAPMLGVRFALEAQAQVLVGDYPGARETFERTARMVAVLHADEMRDMIRMVDAYEAFELRRPDARDLLAAAFAAPRQRQFYDTFDTNPAFGATMCALALDHGVEVEFVRRIIELHGLAPPANAGSEWPWPLRILTFGGLDLQRSGTAVAMQGKAQRKSLELLKALIAFGGHRVDKARLADALWPDAEADAGAAALDMVLSRLRKALSMPDAVRIEDGKVDLDRSQVWVDVWAFDRDVETLQEVLHAPRVDDETAAALGKRLLSRYRGAFLENEAPQRWLLAARDRWRSRFLRSLTDAGRHWERQERWQDAIELYERGIEVDPLAEDLYRKLMRCHLEQRQPAEAARVYRRCRDMLSVQLDIAPSAETEALFKSIYRGM